MDEGLIIVALSPFYVMSVAGAAFVIAHTVRSFMDSATETQIKETIPK